MKLKELFNPEPEGPYGPAYAGFIRAVDMIKPIQGEWVLGIDLDQLDNYIKITAKNKEVYEDFARIVLETYRDISDILSANKYRLDGLYKTTLFEYNPINNYDRTEIQTHNEKVETGDHVSSTSVGARSQTNSNGARSVTNIQDNKNTAFDTADYGKATTKNSSTINDAASTDTISTNAATDTTTEQAYTDNSSGSYNLSVKGNIGVMSTQDMIKQEREVLLFNFYNEVLKIIYEYITISIYEV